MKLLKTTVILTLVVGLLIVGVLPAQAATGDARTQPTLPLQPDWGEGRGAEGKVKVIRGEVTGVGADDIEVNGKTIFVDNETKYRVPTLGREASLEDIELGMQVVVLAYERDDELYARHVVVIPGRPRFQHHVGKVVEYIEGEKIIIQPRSGDPVEFQILDELKVLPPGATVEEDDWVTVISRRDLDNDQLIARGVVVHPLRPWLGLTRVGGTIEEIVGNTITIDTTDVNFDDKTILVLRGGILAVEPTQEAIAFCREQTDGSLLAKVVLVGIDLPGVQAELGRLGTRRV